MNNEQAKVKALFGLDKDFIIKNQLLQVLDNSVTYLTTAELANHFSKIGQDTIQQACRTLKSDIEHLFDEEECRLFISQRHGIKLFCTKESFKKLLNYYAQKELSFILLQDLFLYRELTSFDFLEENHISESTLRRKIKNINRSLNKYQLHITYAKKIRIIGTEIAIRSFYFSFLFLTYRQLSAPVFIINREYFEAKAKKIQTYLNLSLDLKEIDIFNLVYYTHEHGVLTQIPLRLSDEQKKLFSQFDMPSKPTFLNNWSLDDWQFFLLFLMSSNLFEEDFSVKICNRFLLSDQKEAQTWIQLYSLHFKSLTSKEKELVQQTIAKSLLFQSFILIEDELFQLFEIIDFNHFNQLFPHYFDFFHAFWEDFRYQVPILNCNFFRLTSLMLSVYLSPPDLRLHPMTISISSEFSPLFKNFLQEQLRLQFKTKYNFTFTKIPTEADLIIATSLLSTNELTQLTHVIIEPSLTQNDVKRIDEQIQKIIENKNYL